MPRALTDPTPAAALGRAARKTVTERYNLDASVEREIALVRSLGASQ